MPSLYLIFPLPVLFHLLLVHVRVLVDLLVVVLLPGLKVRVVLPDVILLLLKLGLVLGLVGGVGKGLDGIGRIS